MERHWPSWADKHRREVYMGQMEQMKKAVITETAVGQNLTKHGLCRRDGNSQVCLRGLFVSSKTPTNKKGKG